MGCCVSSRYEGDYRFAVSRKDIVWRPCSGVLAVDLFLVVDVSQDSKLVLLTPLALASDGQRPSASSRLRRVLDAADADARSAREVLFAVVPPTVAMQVALLGCSLPGVPSVAAGCGGVQPWMHKAAAASCSLRIAAMDTVGLLQEGTDYTWVVAAGREGPAHRYACDRSHTRRDSTPLPSTAGESLAGAVGGKGSRRKQDALLLTVNLEMLDAVCTHGMVIVQHRMFEELVDGATVWGSVVRRGDGQQRKRPRGAL